MLDWRWAPDRQTATIAGKMSLWSGKRPCLESGHASHVRQTAIGQWLTQPSIVAGARTVSCAENTRFRMISICLYRPAGRAHGGAYHSYSRGEIEQYRCAKSVFLTKWRLRSGAPSFHHGGPRLPSARVAASTAARFLRTSSSLPARFDRALPAVRSNDLRPARRNPLVTGQNLRPATCGL